MRLPPRERGERETILIHPMRYSPGEGQSRMNEGRRSWERQEELGRAASLLGGTGRKSVGMERVLSPCHTLSRLLFDRDSFQWRDGSFFLEHLSLSTVSHLLLWLSASLRTRHGLQCYPDYRTAGECALLVSRALSPPPCTLSLSACPPESRGGDWCSVGVTIA